MTAEAFTLAAEALAASRRSVVRLISLAAAKAIARGLVPYLATNIEAGLLDDLHQTRDGDRVQIDWHAHTGQPGSTLERLHWQPGKPLPDHTLFATCTASAPLQD